MVIAARPPEASWEAGGAFPIPALTAAQALDEALGIESGGWVVVNGAGGVTGGLLVQDKDSGELVDLATKVVTARTPKPVSAGVSEPLKAAA